MKKPIVGRPLIQNKVQFGGVISISFPRNQRDILLGLNEATNAMRVSRSELARDALYMMYNVQSIVELETLILNRYRKGRLEGPSKITNFDNLLEYELKNSGLIKVALKWEITNKDMAHLLYRYCMKKL